MISLVFALREVYSLFFHAKKKKVYVAAIRNRRLQLPHDTDELYEVSQDKEAAKETEFLPHTNAFRSANCNACTLLH